MSPLMRDISDHEAASSGSSGTAGPANGFWPAFRAGAWATLPLQLATVPVGVIFGVIAVEAGLDLAQVIGFAAIVMAGASSLVALELLSEQAPALVVVGLSALVNLRMAMYSAALVPHWQGAGARARLLAGYVLNDQSFAVAIRAYEEGRTPTLPERLGLFFGSGACCIPIWTAATIVGALAGQAIPASWGVEIAVPMLFLALPAVMIRTPAHMIACAVAMAVAVAAAGLPNGLGVIPAAAAGIAAGMAARRAGVR